MLLSITLPKTMLGVHFSSLLGHSRPVLSWNVLFSFLQVAISPEPRITKLFTVLVRQVEEQGAFKDVKAVCDGKNIFTVRPLPSDEMVISGVELPKKEYVVFKNARRLSMGYCGWLMLTRS
jgi:hypothetical protein